MENNPILTQRHLAERPNPVTCAGHADLIQTVEGDWWAVFLACRPIDNRFENLGRETFLMPVKWSDDGFPYLTQGDDLIPLTLKREGVRCDSIVTFGNFEEVETFNDSILDMRWMTLRAPATELYSLTQTPGYLTLKCADVSSMEKIHLHLSVAECSIISTNVLPVCCLNLRMSRKQPDCCCSKTKHTSILWVSIEIKW